jgi:hypothetical protein
VVALPDDFIEMLKRLNENEDVRLFLFASESERTNIVKISSAANQEIYSDPDVVSGSNRWVRLQWSAVQRSGDGLTIEAFGLSPIDTAIAKTVPQTMLAWLGSHNETNAYSNLMLSAPLIGFIAVRDRYDQQQCLLAGRTWQRLHLFRYGPGNRRATL